MENILETKEQLVHLIEAYAVAKATTNETLVRMSASSLQEFINRHDLVPIEAKVEE